MPWVLVAVAVVWILALLFVTALCVSARRTDKKIAGDDVAPPPAPRTKIEPAGDVEDITVRRTALS